MESLKESSNKYRLMVHLEYGCFPIWIYDEENELIENALPEELKEHSELSNLCTEIQTLYNNLYINKEDELSYRGFESEEDRELYAKKVTKLKKLLREVVNDRYEIINEDSFKRIDSSNRKKDPIKVEVNLRDKSWRNGLIASCLMLLMGLLILSIGIYAKSVVGMIIGGLSTLMFGSFTFLLMNPSQHVSMQMVNGEMSYKELKRSIESEEFERPIHFLYGAGKPTLFLISENWVVLGDKIGTPVYIPKSKIKSVEVRSDILDIEDHKSWDGQAHRAPYYYFRFRCDEKHIFECGCIYETSLEGALHEIHKHLPIRIFRIDKDIES